MTEASERGERARQLLEDEVLQAALAALEADALNTALLANTYEPHEAVSALCHLKAAHAVRPQLLSLITTGKAEERKRPAVA